MVSSTVTDTYIYHQNEQEQQLYDHLMKCVQTQSPAEVITLFRRLFIEGGLSPEPQIREAIENIIASKHVEEKFKYILNRCCHILINSWQINSDFQAAIPEFINLFHQIHPPNTSSSRTSRKIRMLVQDFLETEQYRTLDRLGRVIREHQKKKIEIATSVGGLINRYPYLYQHCLVSDDSNYEQRKIIRRIQLQTQKKLEVNLSHYVTYQVRLAQAVRQQRNSPEKHQQIIQKIENPTLLTDRELGVALKKLVGKVEGGYTYQELSRNFINHTNYVSSYKLFKDDLYEYIQQGIDPSYGKVSFNNKLYQNIQSIFPEANGQKPNELLLMRTSNQLLNYLVVESHHRPQHYVFVDLITNIGAAATVGLLLKLILACRKLKPVLEKKFSILFSHYESFNRDGVPWLIQAMENLNVAFSIYFGNADVSCLKYIM